VSVPPLPSGFVLDDDSQAPEPPQGFVADTGGQTPAPPQGFVADGGAPQEQPGATLADYGRSAMAGGAQVGRGAGWGLRQLGEAIDLEGIAGAGRGLEDVSQRAVESWQEGMTPAARAEMGKQFVRETPEGDYELGDAGLATTGLMAAGSALPTMLGMGIGGVAVKGLGAASGAMGAGAHPVIEGAIGYGLGEAAVSAPTAGAEVYARVMDLDVGALEQHPEYAALKEQYGDKTQEAIADAASLQAAGQSGLSTFALSAPMGAMLGKILRGVPTATTRARAVASGAAGEAGQEFAQSGAEQALSNLAVQQRADPSQRLGEGVLEAAVGGAAAGGLMGGGIGTMARLEPVQPALVAPEPAVPEPAVPEPAAPLAQSGEPFSLDTAENQGEIWTYMGPSRTNPATMAEMISPNGIITDVGLDVLVPMEQALEQETTQPTPGQAQQAAPQDAAIQAALPEGTERRERREGVTTTQQRAIEYAKQDTEVEKGDGRGVPQPPIEIEDTEKGGVRVQPRGPGGREKEEITSGLPVQREGGRGVEPSGGVGPVAGEEGGIVSADFNEMVADAARWQGAARKVAARYGDDKKAALRHSRMTTKGDMDAYLMRKFGIDEATARAVSNHLTAQDIKPDESGRPEDFQGEPWADVEQQKKVSGAEEKTPEEEPWAARLNFDAETIERHPDLKDPEAMAGIRHMAEGAGWSEIGGRVIRGADEQVSGRTVWTPKEAWFAEKPQGVTAQHFKGAVERLDAGRKLTKPQREALSFMVAYTQEMQADEFTPTAGTNEYDSMSAFDKGLTVLALELDEIDPGAGESILESAATRDLSNAETRVEIEKALSDKRVAGVAGAEAGRGEEFGLEGQTETQARQKAAEGEQRKQAELEQERKDKADRERGEFVLSGSTAAVDEAEARGQANLFDEIQEELTDYGDTGGVQDKRRGPKVPANQLAFNLEFAPEVLAEKAQQADNFAAHYKQVPVGTIRSGVTAVKSDSDAAHVLAPIRKHGQETFVSLVLDKQQRPISIIRHTKGAKDQSSVYPNEVAASIAATPGADSVWFGHNHPSGFSSPSRADIAITERMIAALDGSGITPIGHIVVGSSGKAHSFGPRFGDDLPVTIQPKLRKRLVPITEAMVRKVPAADRQSFTSPGEVARYVKSLHDSNAAAGIIVSKNAKAAKNLARYLNNVEHIRVLDAFVPSPKEGVDGLVSSALAGERIHEEGGPFYARKKGAPAGTSPEVVQRSARRVVAKHDLLGKGVSFVVAPTSASLPKHIRAAMKTQGAEDDVQGVLDGRTVYLVANRLDSPADVERVILHEMLGHHGARKLFGPRVVSRVSRVHKAVGGDAGIRALGRKHGFDMEPYFETANELYKSDPMGREFLLADELLAHLAQSGPKSLPVKVVRALREFIGAMRDWLARHGYRSLAKMNDADLAYLLRNMRKAAKAPAGKEVQPIRGIDEQAFSRKATGYTEGLDSLLEKTGGDMTKAGKRLHTASMHPATKQLAHGRGELHFMTRSAMGAGAFDLIDGFYDPETKVFLSREDAKRVVRATYGETIGAPSKTHLESQELRRTRNADEAAGRATGIEVEELAADDPALEGLELPWADAARFARVAKVPPAATRRKPGAVVGNVETTPVSPDIRYSRMRQSGRPRSGEFIITGYDDYGRPKFGKTRHESLKHKSVLRAAMDKYFTKEGNLTRETFDRKIKMEGDKSAVDVTAEFLTHAMRRATVKSLRKPWSKIDAATKREINEQLAGRKTNLPKSVKAAIAPLRADLDARSNGLIRMKLDLIQLRMAGLDDKTRMATAAAMDDIMSGRTDYADMDMTGLDKYSISGVAMIKTIQANKGEYLNRAYQIHDDPKWEKRVRENAQVMAAAENLLRGEIETKDLARKEKEARAIVEKATPWKEEIKGPGTMADKAQRRRERVDAEIGNIPGLAEDEVKALVDGAISRMLLAGAKSRDLVSFLSSEQLGQKDLGILMRRKGIPEPIRRLLGEYKDPQYNYVRSASKMTHLTASHDFLMGVRRDGLGQFLSLGETKAFPAEITTFAAEEMNPLTGLYTTPEFNQAMKDAVGPKQLDGLIRTALAANSAVKYGATVLSPITAARNFYSAGFFTVMNGHFNWGHAKKSAAITLADLAKKGDTEAAKDYTVKMVELGVLHSGVRSEELWDAAQDALDMDKPQSRTSEALKTAFIKIPTKIYRAGDDFWKVIGFENEREGLMKHRGMSEPQAEKVAAERIRNGYPTYSHVPRTIQMLRRFPLMGPFVSFPWEIMRTTSHQLRFLKEDYDAGAMPLVYRRAAGMIVAGSIGQAVSLAAMAALGLDSDDDEAYRENGPRWQRNSQLFYHRDNEGKMWTLDLSHLDPYTYLKAPITALLSGRDVTPMAKLGDAMVQLLEPFLGVEITTGAIVEVLMNQRIDSGAPVYNEAASDWDKAGAALNHLRRKLQPGFARQLENLYLASQGHVSRGGKEYTLPGEAATFVGFRLTPMNPEISLKYRAYEFNDARSDASRLLSYPLSDPNKLTAGGIKDAYDSMIDARKLLYKDMIAAVKSSKTLGMTNMEVRRMLRGAGVSRKDISALIRGEVAKWRPSPQFLRRSQATLLAAVKTPAERAEVRRLFGERRREVQRLAAGAQ